MDLSSHFVAFAQLGASWVLWLLVVLSVVSIGVMIDRALWFRGRATDTERFTRELRGAFERDELDRLETKYQHDTAIPVQVADVPCFERAELEGQIVLQVFEHPVRIGHLVERVGGGYGFHHRAHVLHDFASRCQWLQTETGSPFVQRVVCHRFTSDGLVSLRGAVVRTMGTEGNSDTVIDSRVDYARVLRHTFGLSLTDHEIDTLWSRVWPTHLAWVASTRDAISSA